MTSADFDGGVDEKAGPPRTFSYASQVPEGVEDVPSVLEEMVAANNEVLEGIKAKHRKKNKNRKVAGPTFPPVY